MSRPIVTKEQMLRRVAFFKDLKASNRPLIDAVLPQFERENFNIIGRGVTEDATMHVAIPEAEGFHLTLVKAAPGKGSDLHVHQTVEVFVPLTGNWSFQWGDDGENELRIGPWDVISLPTGIMRGFRNETPVDAFMLTIIGGTDPGKVVWNEKLLAAVRSIGYQIDEHGAISKAAAQDEA